MPALPFRLDGIDVAYGEPVQDWTQVAGSGLTIGVCRIHTNELSAPIDTQFRSNWPRMRDAGLIRGAYAFFAPIVGGTRQAVENACDSVTAEITNSGGFFPGDLPLVFDVERLN